MPETRFSDNYYAQANFLLEILPFVAEEKNFALKGGTAINMFHFDLPRLSVDIDLTYLPLKNRDTSVKEISEGLERISKKILKLDKNIRVDKFYIKQTKKILKLYFYLNDVMVKIEPNTVVRGAVYPVLKQFTSPKVQEIFQKNPLINMLSSDDLWGGKFCAALERGHPRDFFDVKMFFEKENISKTLIRAFIFYLLSSGKPFHEMLSPREKDISKDFENRFIGMTSSKTSLESLYAARNRLKQEIIQSIPKTYREFLISISELRPKWELYDFSSASQMPSVKWKLLNLEKMDKKKRAEQTKKLEQILS